MLSEPTEKLGWLELFPRAYVTERLHDIEVELGALEQASEKSVRLTASNEPNRACLEHTKVSPERHEANEFSRQHKEVLSPADLHAPIALRVE